MGSGSSGKLRIARVVFILLALVAGAVWAARSLLDVQARRLVRRGQAELEAGHFASGLDCGRLALRLRPSSADAALLAARCLSRMGRDEEAAALFRQAGPLGLDDQRARAARFLQRGQLDRGKSVLEEILRLDPRDAEALRSLAGIHQARGEYVLAERLARRLADEPSSEIVGQALLGTLHQELAAQKVETPAAAIRAFERVLQLDPELARCPIQPRRLFWDFLARDLLAEGRPAEARRHLETALSSGEDAGFLELLGQVDLAEGRFEEAARRWERAAALDPSLADPWIHLGELALKQDRAADAVRYLARATELSPDSVNPLYKMIQAQSRLGHHEEAARLRQRLDALRGRGR